MPKHDFVQLNAYDAWCDGENHETISVLNVDTPQFPDVVWRFTKPCLVMLVYVNSACDILARFMTYGGVNVF